MMTLEEAVAWCVKYETAVFFYPPRMINVVTTEAPTATIESSPREVRIIATSRTPHIMIEQKGCGPTFVAAVEDCIANWRKEVGPDD